MLCVANGGWRSLQRTTDPLEGLIEGLIAVHGREDGHTYECGRDQVFEGEPASGPPPRCLGVHAPERRVFSPEAFHLLLEARDLRRRGFIRQKTALFAPEMISAILPASLHNYKLAAT